MGSDVNTFIFLPQCYDHLTQWDRLESAATANWATDTGHRATDSVDLLKIWDNTYYEVLLLPQLCFSGLVVLVISQLRDEYAGLHNT